MWFVTVCFFDHKPIEEKSPTFLPEKGHKKGHPVARFTKKKGPITIKL